MPEEDKSREGKRGATRPKANIFQRLFDPLASLPIKTSITEHFRFYFAKIILIHFIFAGIAIYCSIRLTAVNASILDKILVFCSVFATVAILSGLFILYSSIRSEALIRQAYEFAVNSTRAETVDFASFEDHVLWIKQHLHPSRYPSTHIRLYMSFSTPAYGLAMNDNCKSATLFLDYISEWVSHFEAMPPQNGDPPQWEICLWNKAVHQETFAKNVIDTERFPEQMKCIDILSPLLGRIYALNRSGRVSCHLYFSGKTDTRWFFLKTNEDEFAGLVTIFSPLSASAIKEDGWSLVGIHFNDRDSFEHLSSFNRRLQIEDHAEGKKDSISVLKNPSDWLNDHYNITKRPTKRLPPPEPPSEAEDTPPPTS